MTDITSVPRGDGKDEFIYQPTVMVEDASDEQFGRLLFKCPEGMNPRYPEHERAWALLIKARIEGLMSEVGTHGLGWAESPGSLTDAFDMGFKCQNTDGEILHMRVDQNEGEWEGCVNGKAYQRHNDKDHPTDEEGDWKKGMELVKLIRAFITE